jgi:hypothetical protein
MILPLSTAIHPYSSITHTVNNMPYPIIDYIRRFFTSYLIENNHILPKAWIRTLMSICFQLRHGWSVIFLPFLFVVESRVTNWLRLFRVCPQERDLCHSCQSPMRRVMIDPALFPLYRLCHAVTWRMPSNKYQIFTEIYSFVWIATFCFRKLNNSLIFFAQNIG